MGGSGQATVWVTRDKGKVVMHRAKVPAGLTAMQALARVAKLQTRYGGRYVKAVDGVGEKGRRAWFYYVNGYLADQGAAEYRLHNGDVEWWDYRSWRNPADDPLVVGAFPEPFLHGYGGDKRPAVVASNDPRAGRRLARLLHARLVPATARVRRDTNILLLDARGKTRFEARFARDGTSPGSPVLMVFAGNPGLLLRKPMPYRLRYSVP